MESINSFYLPQLHNGENANFHAESLEQLEKTDTVKLGVGAQALAYRAAYGDLKLSIDVFSSSSFSSESSLLDADRDRAYSAFTSFVKVYVNDNDEIKSEAAERVLDIIRKSKQEVGDPIHLGLAKESTALASLLRNLEPFAADIERIGATNRLNRLKEASQAYIDLQFERYIEKSGKHSGDVKAARVVTDAAYKGVIDRINAQILLNGDEGFTAYVKAQNAVIERYKLIVAQRKGRTGKNTAAPETTSETETNE
ncbi:MAG: DUF6261 family protein [Prevotellaceae bacterium]|jgi:hypothetical protein|nr:DUF6261 family protein [Prevotellaceae bacterium]